MVTTARVDVKVDDGGLVVDDFVYRLLIRSAIELQRLGAEEAPVYTGALRSSWQPVGMPSRGDRSVVVGTPLEYGGLLARGLPDPSVRYEDLVKWARRKGIAPWRVPGIYEKIKTVGPTPNPFHSRAADRFVARFPGLIEEVAHGG